MTLKQEHLVVLVDDNDREVGTYPKLLAHTEGKLHRAVSVFVFDGKNRLLLQRRAHGKYHSEGLWSNTCCTHPYPAEAPAEAASRRLREEMGFECSLQSVGRISYRAVLENGLIEHEYDHLFAGLYAGTPRPDPDEVSDWRWIEIDELERHHTERPGDYTAWFWSALDRVRDYAAFSSS
ncbi:MAG: isopentenyl-diphosphate Delta-isomerase [Gemmatimonadota bacterium]|nr:MAG: isopentenyl-diphosphate Delta-isomerase [Gemmatimonadota bacterium]